MLISFYRFENSVYRFEDLLRSGSSSKPKAATAAGSSEALTGAQGQAVTDLTGAGTADDFEARWLKRAQKFGVPAPNGAAAPKEASPPAKHAA